MALNIHALRDAVSRLLATQPVARIEAATDAVRTPARTIGQILQAQLVAELPNGRSLIDVEGVHVDVKLPLPARVGETLELEVLALEPRLTFSWLGRDTGAQRDAVSVSASFRQLAAVLEHLSAEAPGRSSTRALAAPAPSPAGEPEAASPAAVRAAPLLSSPPVDTAQFAERLKTALTRSGLFYESHQAQWLAGERPIADLMQEPQAALKSTNEAVHPQTVPIVQQQLTVLDTGQIVWVGEAWPRQSLEWRIEEEGRHEASDGETPAAWKTSLRLTLPQLGDVTATLSIRGDDVRLAFADLNPDAAGAVNAGRPALHTALANAGLRLSDFVVRDASHDEAAG